MGNLLTDKFRTFMPSALSFSLVPYCLRNMSTWMTKTHLRPTKICSPPNATHQGKHSYHSTGCPGHTLGIFLIPFPVLPFSNPTASPVGPTLKIYPKSSNSQPPLPLLILSSSCHFGGWPQQPPNCFHQFCVYLSIVYSPHRVILKKCRSAHVNPALKTIQWLCEVLTKA